MANYARRSNEEIFDLLQEVAKEKWPDKSWSGLQRGDLVWLLSQIVTEASVMIGINQDFRAREAYLGTAEQKHSVRAIAKNIGLVPVERSGATTTLSLVATNTITIPKGSEFISSNNLVFSTLNTITLNAANSYQGSVDVIHAAYEQITYRARGDVLEKASINKEDLLIEKLTVVVNSEAWEQVDTLKNVDNLSKVYLVDFDEFDNASLQFGDGTYGKRLPADAEVLIDTFSGGGPEGNSVIAGDITTLLSTIANSSNLTTITNANASSGGATADSIEDIAAQLPAIASSVSGLINKTDSPAVLKQNLSWVADAKLKTGFDSSSGVYIPTATVVAFPNNNSVVGMSDAQSSELNTILDTRGEIGVKWLSEDAYAAPVEIELEITLANRSLQSQKETEIKGALTGDEGLFAFKNLRFDNTYTGLDIINAVSAVDGIVSMKLNKLSVVPQTIKPSLNDPMLDIELGDEAEDGYYLFRTPQGSGGTPDANGFFVKADVHFFRPILATQVSSTFVQDISKNWIVKEFSFESGSQLDDTNGPWIKTNGANKLEIKQITSVLKNDQFNGATYNDKYIVRVLWVDTDSNNKTKIGYWHISDTTSPDIITSSENSASPISGDAITTLAAANNINISVQIIKDQSTGSTLCTQTGQQFSITHNDKNKVYVSGAVGSVPTNSLSYIHFNEDELDVQTGTGWLASTNALRVRYNDRSFGGDVSVYTTPLLAKKLEFKEDTEVFTLSNTNITLRFV